MFQALAGALAFFYDLWPSYGGAIILLTLAIMLVLSPLSIKATRSMLAMSRLQPEIKKLQVKYKDDRQKLNEEMMAFYQANKINPFSSCLPLLLQMPIFLVLYRVIAGLNRVDSGNGGGPSYLSQSSQLYQDLKATIPTGPDPNAIEMEWMGIDLSHSLTNELSANGIVAALPYFVLVALVAITGYIQQRQISGRNTGATINPQQQMITRLLPGFMAVISISIPAGLVLYFVVSNCVRIGQQALVTRMEGGPDAAPTPATAVAVRGAPAAVAGGGLLARFRRPGRGSTTTNPSSPSTPGAGGARPAPSAKGGGSAPSAAKPAPSSGRPTPSKAVGTGADGAAPGDGTGQDGGDGAARGRQPARSRPTPSRPSSSTASGTARSNKKRRRK